MFSSQRQKGTVLVVDVDDASVGVAIVATGEVAYMRQANRAMLPVEKRSPEHSASAIAQLLADTIDATMKAYMSDVNAAPIAATYAIVRAPWVRFRTAHLEEKYTEPVLVSDTIITEFAKKALQLASDFTPANRLESGIVHAYLNGYPTANPGGKHASQIAMTVYESDITMDARTMVTETLLKALPGRQPIIRSSVCALLSIAGEYLPTTNRSILIDVGASSTHCAVVVNDAVVQTKTVFEGLATILSRVGGGAFPEETLTQLRMLATDTCATDACKSLKDSLARVEPELAKVFGEIFAGFTRELRLPNTAILSAPGELMPWLSGFFSRIDFSQFTATMQPLEVETLTAEHLSTILHWEGRQPDTALGIAGAYVNILASAAK